MCFLVALTELTHSAHAAHAHTDSVTPPTQTPHSLFSITQHALTWITQSFNSLTQLNSLSLFTHIGSLTHLAHPPNSVYLWAHSTSASINHLNHPLMNEFAKRVSWVDDCLDCMSEQHVSHEWLSLVNEWAEVVSAWVTEWVLNVREGGWDSESVSAWMSEWVSEWVSEWSHWMSWVAWAEWVSDFSEWVSEVK